MRLQQVAIVMQGGHLADSTAWAFKEHFFSRLAIKYIFQNCDARLGAPRASIRDGTDV